MKSLVVLARLGAPHGVRGALSVSQAGAHLRAFTGKKLSICKSLMAETGILTEYSLTADFTLSHADPAKGQITRVQFAEVTDRDAAAELTNYFAGAALETVQALAAEERGGQTPAFAELWYFELVGLIVVDAATKAELGTITAVEDLGLNTLVTVTPGANQDQIVRPMEIPLDYPHWQKLDLLQRRVALAEWQILSDGT